MPKSEVEKIRTRVQLKDDCVKYTSSTDFPGSVPGYDDAWDLDKFQQQCRVDIVRQEGYDLEFDLVGVDASLANALRRIMLVEVPTFAIETVYFENNTSIIQDEILAHRLGLVPLNVNPYGSDYPFVFKTPEDDPTDENTLVFKLHVKHEGNSKKKQKSSKPLPKTLDVFSSAFEWQPQGQQEDHPNFKANGVGIRPVYEDILLVKLRAGQEVNATLHCHLGTGKDHAKWSPVGTASYRLLPEIVLKEKVTGETAHRLQKCFSAGVIEIVDEDGEEVARVANPRLETMSREVFRHPDLAPFVELNRVRDHFIFSVESIGAVPPDTIFVKAIEILQDKCATVLQALDSLNSD